jgi:hypothetical protein
VRLYDAILGKLESSPSGAATEILPQMRHFRNEVREHEEFLEAAVRSLGGDAHAETERSRLQKTEASGIEQVILNPASDVAELFHALLAAELVDSAGWDLLVSLADEAGDREAKRAFKQRLREEREHLEFVRVTSHRLARLEVFGEIEEEILPPPAE